MISSLNGVENGMVLRRAMVPDSLKGPCGLRAKSMQRGYEVEHHSEGDCSNGDQYAPFPFIRQRTASLIMSG